MGSKFLTSRSPVLIFYSQPERVISAQFVWPTGTIETIYNSSISNDVIVQFDSSVPVRPAAVIVREATLLQSEPLLQKYLGGQLAQHIINAPLNGMSITEAILEPAQRMAIAELQADDIRTPTGVYRACRALLEEMNVTQPKPLTDSV